MSRPDTPASSRPGPSGVSPVPASKRPFTQPTGFGEDEDGEREEWEGWLV